MKYDSLVTRPGAPTVATKIWVKKSKMRIETSQQGQAVVLLIDGNTQTVYRYIPAQNTASKMPFPPSTRSAIQEARSIPNFNPEVSGTETIDGKICLVIKYVANALPTKAWIWQDYGIPIRIEAGTTGGMTTVQYNNIDFIDIPDSMFELPTGAKVDK